MDVKDLNPDLEKLGENLDELEETLQPLIDNLPEMSSELPLLDKAKLMTMTAYSIESLLFCTAGTINLQIQATIFTNTKT